METRLLLTWLITPVLFLLQYDISKGLWRTDMRSLCCTAVFYNRAEHNNEVKRVKYEDGLHYFPQLGTFQLKLSAQALQMVTLDIIQLLLFSIIWLITCFGDWYKENKQMFNAY